MTVIAMTREMGSRGRDVAVGLAEELGLELVQHQMVEHVADKMHMRETSVNRFLEGKASLFERWGVNERDLSLYTTEEILDVAERGNVIIRGWGATYVLRDIAHIPCIRVCAPLELRCTEVMDRVGLADPPLARREVLHNDAAHARTMSHLFHARYEDPLLYDLVLNTGHVPVEVCVELIKQLAASEAFQETDASRAKLQHMKIEAAMRAALRSNSTTSRMPPSFEAHYDPATSTVRLSGVAEDRKYREEAERVVREVPGIKGVDNEMLVIKASAYGGP